MNHDPEALGAALNAKVELPPETDSQCGSIIYRFRDSRLLYEMHIDPHTGEAIFAMDPTEPMQGCPMFELNFRCTEIMIGSNDYEIDGSEVAVLFYEDVNSSSGRRLTMT